MNYLVTGIAGFIGSKISRKLIDAGHRVIGIDNLSTGYKENIPKEALFIEGACQDITLYKHKELTNTRFDAIFHIAGQSSGEVSFENPVYDLESNTTSTLLLLQFAKSNACKNFIFASTMSVYGESDKQQYSEIDIVNPKSFYAVGKIASENYLKIYHKQYNIRFVVLRYFNVYGPGQNFENLQQGMVSIYLKQFLDSAYKEVVVKGSFDRFRDQVYIDDVVDITVEAMESNLFDNQIVNIGTAKPITVKNIINMIQAYTGSNKQVIETEGTPGDQFGIFSDNNKLLSISCHKNLVEFEVGLKNMIESIKINEQ